ncbi:MAG: hypothetical protein IT372_16755 [Polyangiaceae bacterium]|nr:hypothetical protein [Polyangiaceae bacterium]
MSAAARLGLAAASVAALAGLAASCGTVRGAYDACEAADECVAPYVCCTAPRIPAEGQKIPYCERLEYCDGFLPFLVEGNPCHREPDVPWQECAEGLECCPESLTCGGAGSCTGVVPAPTGPSSGAACVADGECPGGEVCCGINLFYRLSGVCKAVAECAPAPP